MARVLVVEDDLAFRGLVVQIFTRWGHDVFEAGGVEEALACAVERRPDTVVTDVGLPDGDGFDVTTRVLALTWPVRVIVVSADASVGNRNAAKRAGAIRFFSKEELFDDGVRHLIA